MKSNVKCQMSDVRKGFSMVEMLVVLAIIGIMSSVGIISMRSNKLDKELEVAGKEVAAAIREAQNNALAGKNASSTNPICKQYTFMYTNNTANYSMNCDGNYQTNYVLKNGVEFSSGGNFSFSIPFGETDLAVPVKDISLSKGGSDYHVCVEKSGSVYENKDSC